jgi:hypothetical protein
MAGRRRAALDERVSVVERRVFALVLFPIRELAAGA